MTVVVIGRPHEKDGVVAWSGIMPQPRDTPPVAGGVVGSGCPPIESALMEAAVGPGTGSTGTAGSSAGS